MSKYQYILQPRTYKTVMRAIDEFYEWCTENQKTPTLTRLDIYMSKKALVAPTSEGLDER